MTFGRADELYIQMSRQQFQRFLIGQVDTMIACSKSQQTVQGTGIQQTPTQALGQNPGDSALARATWPIDGDDWRLDVHD